MINVWEVYPRLTAIVRRAHVEAEMAATGHPFDHVLQVAQVAAYIAESEDIAKLAAAAGLCHNADRILQRQIDAGGTFDAEAHATAKVVIKERAVALISSWLKESGEFCEIETGRVLRAVSLHSGFNLGDGDNVLVALQDADRVVCSMADNVMTAAQFWAKLPAIDPKWLDTDPEAHAYKNPRSVLRNLLCRRDWADPGSPVCVRLPKAFELMARRMAFLEYYIEEVREQREEIGLWPDYPV